MNGLVARHPDKLTVREGCASGADAVVCRTWGPRNLDEWTGRHRHFPVDWSKVRRDDPVNWRAAGPARNTDMLADLVNVADNLVGGRTGNAMTVAFHDNLDPAKGGTSDMVIRSLMAGIAVWHVSGEDPRAGVWLRTFDDFDPPAERLARIKEELIVRRIGIVAGV